MHDIESTLYLYHRCTISNPPTYIIIIGARYRIHPISPLHDIESTHLYYRCTISNPSTYITGARYRIHPISPVHDIESTHLLLVLVHHLVPGVHGGSGSLGDPDPVHDAAVCERDDDQRKEVLDDDHVEAVDLGRVDLQEGGVLGETERLRVAKLVLLQNHTVTYIRDKFTVYINLH